jgi:hypothetical protein
MIRREFPVFCLILGACAGAGDPAEPDDASIRETLAETFLADIARDLSADDMAGREEGTPESAEARARIVAELTACGVQPAGENDGYEQVITSGGGTNILGWIPGSDPDLRDRYIVLSAHYDHIGACGGAICNGANDNAAGVATIVGVGCAVAKAPLPRSVLVASWDAEEPSTFLTDAMGSEFWVGQPTVPLSGVDAAIVLDLVGADLWPGYDAHFLLGAELSPGVAAALDGTPVPAGLDANRLGLHMVEETAFGRQPWSDYDAFRNRGVPVLFATNGQNLEYHSAADEFASLDTARMALQATYLYDFVVALGGASATPGFDPSGADHRVDAATAIRVADAALAAGGLVELYGLNATSRSNIESDRAAAEEAAVTLEAGGELSAGQVAALRSATQRIMCFAGPSYNEATCNLL